MEILIVLVGFTIKYIIMVSVAIGGVCFGRILRIRKMNMVSR